MKRKMLKWLSLFAIIGIASCSQEEPLNGSSRTIQNENSGQDERISVEEALEMFIYGSNPDGSGTHVWVGDGYKGTHNVSRKLRKRKDEFMWTEVSRTDVTTIYNHFNWGWNGLYNGYFLDGTFGNYGDNVGYFMVKKIVYKYVKYKILQHLGSCAAVGADGSLQQ